MMGDSPARDVFPDPSVTTSPTLPQLPESLCHCDVGETLMYSLDTLTAKDCLKHCAVEHYDDIVVTKD